MKPPHIRVAPSILSADFARLGEVIETLNQSEADWIHVDIMDGVFVPNLSFGFSVVDAIAPLARKPLDVHLMITEPERYVERFVAAGAQTVTIHYEACPHLHRCLQLIHRAGAKAGVAINPHTAPSLLAPVLAEIDLVCVMGVNPGFGGQSFIPYTFEKLRELRTMRQRLGSQALLEVDGGINFDNLAQIAPLADVLVAGNAVFKAPELTEAIAQLRSLAQKSLVAQA
jgi:ribulose-phosphate 3-epimerase